MFIVVLFSTFVSRCAAFTYASLAPVTFCVVYQLAPYSVTYGSVSGFSVTVICYDVLLFSNRAFNTMLKFYFIHHPTLNPTAFAFGDVLVGNPNPFYFAIGTNATSYILLEPTFSAAGWTVTLPPSRQGPYQFFAGVVVAMTLWMYDERCEHV